MPREIHSALIEHNYSLLDLEIYTINTVGAVCNKQLTSNEFEYVKLKHENRNKLIEYTETNGYCNGIAHALKAA